MLSQAEAVLFVLSCDSILSLYFILQSQIMFIFFLYLMQFRSISFPTDFLLFFQKLFKWPRHPWFVVGEGFHSFQWETHLVTTLVNSSMSDSLNIAQSVALRQPAGWRSYQHSSLKCRTCTFPCFSTVLYTGMSCIHMWSHEPRGGRGMDLYVPLMLP